jgi:hypothetical protein
MCEDSDDLTGRERSSRNALKHGLCSKILILPDESQEEFDELLQGWMDDYQPATQAARGLVVRAARAEWLLMRALRRYDEAEQSIHDQVPDPMNWTEEHHKKMERYTRYRTTEERAFTRAFNMLEHLRKSRNQEAAARRRLENQNAQQKKNDAPRPNPWARVISRPETPQKDAENSHPRPVGGNRNREWPDRHDPVSLE